MKHQRNGRTSVLCIAMLACGFFSISSVCSALEYVWAQKTDMSTPRWLHASASVNGEIYVMGGFPSEGTGAMLASIEAYDPASDTWTKRADMPTSRGYLAASVVRGKIYAIGGGGDGGSRVEAYDPATDTWTRKADMPTERRLLATCVLDGKIYAIGGTPLWGVWSGMKTVEVYDPMTDAWTKESDMNTGVWGLCANVVKGKIYVFGGRPTYTALAVVQEYDPETDAWTQKADMPLATSQMASIVLDDKVFVMGGWLRSDHSLYTAVQIYDPETDTWTISGDTPFLRAAVSANVVDNRIYVTGGTDRNHPCPATSSVYEYGPLPSDFNGDGFVDIKDLLKLIESWGQNDTQTDLVPLLGDAVVDALDLEELMGHWEKEVDDPTLMANWKLNEIEGDIAYDSAAENDAIVMGDATWQPDEGQVGGALQLDGMDDYIDASCILNPQEGVFSVFAWIKGRAPGQVILSQEDGVDWLLTDTQGCLMTALESGGRQSGGPLISETIVTDGNWHRIGFVWDGSCRILYMDDVVVAEDTLSNLAGASGGLRIGTNGNLESGTFFSGMIDDVRIYDRVVEP